MKINEKLKYEITTRWGEEIELELIHSSYKSWSNVNLFLDTYNAHKIQIGVNDLRMIATEKSWPIWDETTELKQ